MIGHNLGLRHTHDDGLDDCVPKGCGSDPKVPFPECLNTDCTGKTGTIMSFCNACWGGLGISDQFHPNNTKPMFEAAYQYLLNQKKLEIGLENMKRKLETKQRNHFTQNYNEYRKKPTLMSF